MDDKTRADLALWISFGSAGLSVAGLAWQLTLYRLSGARLEVRLIPAVLTETGTLVRGKERGWGSVPPEIAKVAVDRPSIDVCIIQVTNVGRAPISVSDISLDFGRSPWWKLRSRHTIAGFPVPIHGALESARPVRLEAGQSEFVIMDLWNLVAGARQHHKRPLRVRASARAAGRRPCRSPRWRRWRIPSDQVMQWPHGSRSSSDQRVFEAVWRGIAHREPHRVYPAWIDVSVAIADEGPAETLLSLISEVLEEYIPSSFERMMIALQVQLALEADNDDSEGMTRRTAPT